MWNRKRVELLFDKIGWWIGLFIGAGGVVVCAVMPAWNRAEQRRLLISGMEERCTVTAKDRSFNPSTNTLFPAYIYKATLQTQGPPFRIIETTLARSEWESVSPGMTVTFYSDPDGSGRIRFDRTVGSERTEVSWAALAVSVLMTIVSACHLWRLSIETI